jgi:Na+/H+-dicarboxylate symporter
MNKIFTAFIVGAMVLGVLVGWGVNHFLDADQAKGVADNLTIITDVFLRLIKMIIAPLVFSTLVAGIAHMEDAASIGRVGIKTMGWFIGASIISLLIGLFMVHLIQPGVGMGLIQDPSTVAGAVDATKLTLKDFVSHLVPKSFAEAMANNEILQIVVFSMFFGVALASLGDKAKTLVHAIDELSHAMLKITGYVMKLAPLAVMAAMAATVAVNGLEILLKFAVFMGDFYLGLFLLWGILIFAGFDPFSGRACSSCWC